jgi:hypothetical protein
MPSKILDAVYGGRHEELAARLAGRLRGEMP